jgi:hypothetical protein
MQTLSGASGAIPCAQGSDPELSKAYAILNLKLFLRGDLEDASPTLALTGLPATPLQYPSVYPIML